MSLFQKIGNKSLVFFFFFKEKDIKIVNDPKIDFFNTAKKFKHNFWTWTLDIYTFHFIALYYQYLRFIAGRGGGEFSGFGKHLFHRTFSFKEYRKKLILSKTSIMCGLRRHMTYILITSAPNKDLNCFNRKTDETCQSARWNTVQTLPCQDLNTGARDRLASRATGLATNIPVLLGKGLLYWIINTTLRYYHSLSIGRFDDSVFESSSQLYLYDMILQTDAPQPFVFHMWSVPRLNKSIQPLSLYYTQWKVGLIHRMMHFIS